jgi:succinate dehydrogenase/fumarate reductase flavoprotein subunit
LAELAADIGADGPTLAATVLRFNAGAGEGVDLDFGRGASALDQDWGDGDRTGPDACLAPLLTAPFYATRVYSGCSGTTGGLVVDPAARVLDSNGAPVPGLFAAGNVMASPFGDTAPGSGSTLGPGMTFGFIAGQSMAAAHGRHPVHAGGPT